MLSALPIWTGNLYCRHHLDRALIDLVGPFAREHLVGEGGGLWWIRNRRGGAHLKLRFHAGGTPAGREELEKTFRDRAASFFGALPGEPDPRDGLSGGGGPAIDPEDEVEHDPPDRTLLPTTFRRTPITFGHDAYAVHDDFLARFATALGAGCAHVLDLLEFDADGAVSFSRRQQILLRLLLVGLGALPFSAAERRQYQLYHRDWLIRFTILQSGAEAGEAGDPERRAAEVTAHFDARVRAMAPVVEGLAGMAAASWGDAAERGEDPWAAGLAELWDWLERTCRGPFYDGIDKYAARPSYLPLFKVVHGVANALGLNLLDEALAHHLLLRASELAEATA